MESELNHRPMMCGLSRALALQHTTGAFSVSVWHTAIVRHRHAIGP